LHSLRINSQKLILARKIILMINILRNRIMMSEEKKSIEKKRIRKRKKILQVGTII
jgi:hypothetical protein